MSFPIDYYNQKATFTVDIAGSEVAFSYILKGCIKALKNFPNLTLILVGNQNHISPAFRRHRRLFRRVRIIHTENSISMEENPTKACRAKPDASIMLAAQTVANNEAFGLYSPGNTGATVVASVLKIGLIPSIRKPAIATPLPTVQGYTLLLDSGANVDISPPQFFTLAKLGQSFITTVFKKEICRTGLLNIGSEPNKGSKTIKTTFNLLSKHLPGFAGNVEGNDIFSGKTDVIVCDGFVGNVIIKLSEGLGKELLKRLKIRRKKQKERSKDAVDQMNRTKQMVSQDLRKITDSEQYGGAPLLGVKGIVLIGHGKAKGRAVFHAIRNALFYKSKEMIPEMTKKLKSPPHLS